MSSERMRLTRGGRKRMVTGNPVPSSSQDACWSTLRTRHSSPRRQVRRSLPLGPAGSDGNSRATVCLKDVSMGYYLDGVIVLLMLMLLVGAWRLRRRRVTPGAAAAGMMQEILNDEQRAAIEVIIEERTGYRDPEDRDGNLPDLEPGSAIEPEGPALAQRGAQRESEAAAPGHAGHSEARFVGR